MRAELHDLLPSILPQLGADNMNTLRKLAEEGYGGAGGFGRGPPGGVGTIEEEDEEDDDGALTRPADSLSLCRDAQQKCQQDLPHGRGILHAYELEGSHGPWSKVAPLF